MKYLFFGFIFLLTSCSFFAPVKSPEKTYYLQAIPCPPIKIPDRPITLLVAPPAATFINNSPLIAYSICPYQISYFSKNVWAATPSQMLQPLIMQTLLCTHYFHAITTSSSIGHVDYILNTEIIDLHHEFSSCCHPGCSEVVFKLQAQLIDTADNHIIASRQFCDVEVAPEKSPYGGVIAANCATAHVLKQLARFCLQKL